MPDHVLLAAWIALLIHLARNPHYFAPPTFDPEPFEED